MRRVRIFMSASRAGIAEEPLPPLSRRSTTLFCMPRCPCIDGVGRTRTRLVASLSLYLSASVLCLCLVCLAFAPRGGQAGHRPPLLDYAPLLFL